MNNKLTLTAGAIASLFLANQVFAAPFSSFDSRSFAMGGTGAASATSDNANFFNPALLAAAQEDDDLSVVVPIIGGRVADPDDFIDAADNFSNSNLMTAYSDSIAAFNAAPSPATANAVDAAGTNLANGLQTLSNKAVQGEGALAFVVGVPSKTLGVSVYGSGWAVGGTTANITSADLTTISSIASTAQTLATVTDPTVSGATNEFTSSVSVRGALITELGVSIAREFDIQGYDLAFGVTPKFLKVETFDTTFSSATLDNVDINTDTGTRSESGVNLDVGVAHVYENGLKTGFVIKNLIAKDYKTVLNNKVTIEPQARIAVAKQTDMYTVALDLDLTENEPVGLESKSQYLGLGAEFDAFDLMQVRVGYRHNMSDSDTSTASLGLGFTPFGGKFDISIAGGSNEIGFSMDLGFAI
ncbi:MAG: conjugal transfer protein TraF [Gammaproteobacteria bacterium]